MGSTPRTPRRGRGQIELRCCHVCGGEWFRLTDWYQFLREEVIVRKWDPKDGLIGQVTPGAMTVGICLCGTPWKPLIGGIFLSGPTELVRAFLGNLDRAHQ